MVVEKARRGIGGSGWVCVWVSGWEEVERKERMKQANTNGF
jgi:hypothetical protein